MKILATSDLHGQLPEVPECDLLLIAGDVTPLETHAVDYQQNWLQFTYSAWLEQIPASNIVHIAGNHDFAYEKTDVGEHLPGHYLRDEMVEIDGVRIYGTPWTPNLRNWAFYGGQGGSDIHYNTPDCDILISHGPPYGCGDTVGPRFGGPKSVGDNVLNQRLSDISCKAVVCGHIHEGHGKYWHRSGTPILNVAYLDEMYRPTNPIVDISDYIN